MLNCHDTTRLLSESRERPLTWREHMALRLHVMMCSGCRRFGEQMRFMSVSARRYMPGGHDSPDGRGPRP